LFAITSYDATAAGRKVNDRRPQTERNYPLKIAEALTACVSDFLERLNDVVVIIVASIAFMHCRPRR
jgi:hypothetical protein